jgi:hypothetical protein
MRQLFFLSIICVISQTISYSQVSNPEIPYSYQYQLKAIKEYVTMPDFDSQSLVAEDAQAENSTLKQKRFAKVFHVDLHTYNSGEWIQVPNGGRTWRLGIYSKDAYSIYFVFGKFHLSNGVSLFIYNNNYQQISKTYSAKNNTSKHILPVAPIPGDSIIIELNVEPGIENFGDLTLTQVWHDYQNAFGHIIKKTNSLLKSGSCNIDVNCMTGDFWQTEKRAVCKIIVDGQLCTGTLINNVRGEKIPYLLTAHHCVQSDEAATTAIFYFEYESIKCKSDSIYSESQIINGATRVASTLYIDEEHKGLDFALLKLNQFPPISYKPYLAGWDISSNTPLGAVCIHHPWGDIKKIATSNAFLSTGNIGLGYNPYSHWKVSKWDRGVTENGSSGSALFNRDHLIIGSLTGGDAECGSPYNDYFTKLSLSWNYYPEAKNQIKAWLDPDNKGVSTLDGYSPFDFDYLLTDTVLNLQIVDLSEISNDNLSSGYITGPNNRHWTQFAEKYAATDTTLLDEVILKVAYANPASSLSNIKLKIWRGGSTPGNEIYSKLLFIKDLQLFENIIYLDTILRIKGDFFIGYEVNYNTPDNFALYHGPKLAESLSTMYIMENDIWYNIKDVAGISYPTSLGIGFIGNTELVKKETRIVRAFPNPCYDRLTLETFKKLSKIDLICFDTSGKKIGIPYRINKKTQVIFDVSGLRRGVYGFYINSDNGTFSGKFVVIR